MMNDEKLWELFENGQSGDHPLRDISEGRTPSPKSGVSRRTFLEFIGFSIAASALTGCAVPEQKIVPYTKQPAELTPGVANWYTSVCGGCNAACGILVKVRDGRPIKLEGNPDHPISKGGLCAVAHAMVFDLYGSERLKQPVASGRPITWETADKEIIAKLDSLKESGGKVRVVTPLLMSPTSRHVIGEFLRPYADAKHVIYEAVSTSAVRKAHFLTHKLAVTPRYRFGRAKLIVSFDADFLGTWMEPVSFTCDYADARDLKRGPRQLPLHVQFESRMSLSGSKADRRIQVSPSESLHALLLLALRVAEATGRLSGPLAILSTIDQSALRPSLSASIDRLAKRIVASKGESIVVSGSNDVAEQYLVNLINQLAGNYGSTLDCSVAVPQPADDEAFVTLVKEMSDSQVGALIVIGANPAYDYHDAAEFRRALEKVPLKISLNSSANETSSLADYVCPQHHFLETWDDAEPSQGVLSINQPAIAPLFQTRAYQESLLRWSGDQRTYHDYLRQGWNQEYFPRQRSFATFDEFWDRTLLDGVATLAAPAVQPVPFLMDETPRAVREVRSRADTLSAGLTAILYQKVPMRDGRHANNPWLQELPDPVTKVTWDNYACISARRAAQMQLQEGWVIRVKNNRATMELPAHIQPGQHDDTVAIALGYGRTMAGRAGNNVGVNAYPLVSHERGSFQYVAAGITIEKTGERRALARTQVQDRLEDRPIVREIDLTGYLKGHRLAESEAAPEFRSLWSGYEYSDHKWGMVIDLNACTGCSACILSCQAENNVPVVGKEEVGNRREMHWIRIDRYYAGTDDDPSVLYQPVMCQQCDNASCESVCPVLATVHSSEGLNMQVYNRCVGTRYCENNCPFKVRRFNWFQYPHSDPIANLALNPDVTVRSRGVMEKCSFCIQRIEMVKIQARSENRPIKDGEIQTACQQTCPSKAITFGNLVDPESQASILKRDHRNYTLLEDLNLRQPTSYLAIVRNNEEE